MAPYSRSTRRRVRAMVRSLSRWQRGTGASPTGTCPVCDGPLHEHHVQGYGGDPTETYGPVINGSREICAMWNSEPIRCRTAAREHADLFAVPYVPLLDSPVPS